jgi:hypothetical protein
MTDTHKVFLPAASDSSVVVDATGHSHGVEIGPDGRRFVILPTESVKQFLESGLGCSLPWREANPHLLGGALGPVEKPEPGVSLSRLQQANAATAPRDPRDRGGMANDALRSMGRRR